MPKATKMKYYAVRNGRQGAKIYTSWRETKENVSRFPGAVHKSFTSLSEAQQWVNVGGALQTTYLQGPQSNWTLPTQDATAGPSHRRGPLNAQPNPVPLLDPAGAQANHNVTPQPLPEPNVVLSNEQRDVLRMVQEGKSVFFTGSAGTGKSVLLREIIEFCTERSGQRPAVTAATGIASVNIGGCTLHSWAGIGLGKESARVLVGKLLGKHKQLLKKDKEKEQQREDEMDWDDYVETGEKESRVVDRWRTVKTLIIDEISMIDGNLFDKLEFIARVLRRKKVPFGGIQLVLSGDFCQLPPVPDRVNGVCKDVKFAFDASTWEECVGRPVVLTHVFRQKDQAFVDMLNEMRFGRLNPNTITEFRKLSRDVQYDDDIEPTDLFPTRREVDSANTSRLVNLSDPRQEYWAQDKPGYDDDNLPISQQKMETILERLVAPKTIILKVGAQVMLIKNLVQGHLVNGSVGRVVAFSTVRNGIKSGAMIAHEQGVTGMNNIAGGRYSHPNSDGKDKDKVPQHLFESNETWPIVRFQNGMTVLCVRTPFEVTNAIGTVEAIRDQVPLILAWALSIHKSQGQTIDRVRVDLGRIFEKGQAYVALSRATSMKSLQVLKFDPGKVAAHPRVLEWMKQITTKCSIIQDDMEFESNLDDDLEFWADEM